MQFSIGRPGLIRKAFLLEWFTVSWMTVEAIVAIFSGIAAHSITLMALGIDSAIELASAGVLIWRLTGAAGLGLWAAITVGGTANFVFTPSTGDSLLQIWPATGFPPVTIPVHST